MNKVAFHEKDWNGQTDSIREAQQQFRANRRRGLDALNQVFRRGSPPKSALEGSYAGELIAIDIAPGISQLLQLITYYWMPWRGKYFISAEHRGDNIFSWSSRVLFRVFFPFYRSAIEDPPVQLRAFMFHTSIAAGRTDPDRQVLKIDYDNSSNPALSIRRILDELVQVDEGVYLGKVHFKWWWGKWQMVAYFSLRRIRRDQETGGATP